LSRRPSRGECGRETQNIQLDAAIAYFDLLQVYGAVAINTDTLGRAEQMLNRAVAADKAGLSRTKADLNRAETEVSVRRQEAIVLRGRAAAASARLVRVLLLDPNVELVPAEEQILPLTLVPPNTTVASMILLGEAQRPDLAAYRSLTDAGEIRERQARIGPLMPKVQVDYLAGGFGGGINSRFENFNGRGDATAALFWEFRNMGLGNLRQVKERQAQVEQYRYQVIEAQARVAAEISENAKLAGARFNSLDSAQKAVQNATEMYRKLLETSFGMIGPKAQYDAIEPLLAIQALNQARTVYLGEVIEFNRAQFRLYTALGQPPLDALSSITATALQTPVVPDGRVPQLPKQ
jgi:outer membrane protein TolC